MTIVLKRRSVLSGIAAASAAAILAARPVSLSQAAAQRPAIHQVEIHGFKFEPASLAVRPGDTITWTNRDLVPHTATARDGHWDTGRIGKGETASLVVEAGMAGDYFCRFHLAMKACVEILPAA